MEHTFTNKIRAILNRHFGALADEVLEKSDLLRYINLKTRSAEKGSKSRSAFANLYAIYVIAEDYLQQGFHQKGDYSKYEGAQFSRLFARQRELPFGDKLQNHALNNRMNSEFQKFFPNSEYIPILRNMETNRYWLNENLLKVKIGEAILNLAQPILEIIDSYIETKRSAFQRFIEACESLQKLDASQSEEVVNFINGLLAVNADARLFEIVSYSILKYHYQGQRIIWGFYDWPTLKVENLKLYKTGRTNANDGGIDFVMKPLGRFFQVTETLDFKKYFLDIDKIEKYPITFVVKSDEDVSSLFSKIRANALKTYSVEVVVDKYMACIEEVINIPILTEFFNNAVLAGHSNQILNEVATQSRVEFNLSDEQLI